MKYFSGPNCYAICLLYYRCLSHCNFCLTTSGLSIGAVRGINWLLFLGQVVKCFKLAAHLSPTSDWRVFFLFNFFPTFWKLHWTEGISQSREKARLFSYVLQFPKHFSAMPSSLPIQTGDRPFALLTYGKCLGRHQIGCLYPKVITFIL